MVAPLRGDLVETVEAVDDHHVAAAELFQHPRLNADQVRMEHAHHLIRRRRWIDQRAEDVKDSAHAEFLADRRRVFHGAVKTRREHETDAHLIDAARNLLRREQDVDAERFQYVGAAAR